MFNKAFAVALIAATSISPALASDGEESEAQPEIYGQEVMLSNISGVSLQIACDLEFCQVQSLQPGSQVWDREEVQPADDTMFDVLVNKYTALGYS